MKNEIKDIESYILEFITHKKPPKDTLLKYRQYTNKNNNFNKISSIKNLKDLNQIKYFFISDRPNYFFLRLALELKKKRIKTVLISRWGPFNYEKKFFSKIFLYDHFEDLKLLSNLQNKVFYIQQWPGYNFLPLYCKHIFNKNNKLICNINDLTKITYKNIEVYTKGNYLKDEIKKDIKYEKKVLETFNFITHFYKDHKIFNKYSNKIKKKIRNFKIIYFPCYPCRSFFYTKKRILNPKKIHLVYIGNCPTSSKGNSDTFLDKTIDRITKNKIKLTYLNNPQNYYKKNNYVLNELSKDNAYFNFKKGFLPWELKSISQVFTFGIMPFYFSNNYSPELMKGPISTKIFTYIEQGLPIIVTNKMRSISDFVNYYKVGIVLNNIKDIKNIKNLIINSDYDQLTKNVINYRNQFSINKQLDEIF